MEMLPHTHSVEQLNTCELLMYSVCMCVCVCVTFAMHVYTDSHHRIELVCVFKQSHNYYSTLYPTRGCKGFSLP